MWPPEIECGQPRGAVGAGIPRREDWPQFCRDWDDAHKPTEVKAQHMLGAAPGDPSYRNFSRETAHHRSSLLADVLHVKFASPHRTTRIGVPGGEAVDFKSLKTIFMRWYGSSFRAAFNSSIFQALIAVYLATFFYVCHDFAKRPGSRWSRPVSARAKGGVAEVQGLMWQIFRFTFFTLVFYTGKVLNRFFARYDDILACNSASLSLATYCGAFFKSRAGADAIVRYALATVYLHYFDLDDSLGDTDWTALLAKNLLTPGEVAALYARNEPHKLPPLWALKTLMRAVDNGDLDGRHEAYVAASLEATRTAAERQVGYNATSVPIHYFHLTTVMLLLFSLLFVITEGVQLHFRWRTYGPFVGASCLAADAVLLYALCAMWWVSVMLSDPTGDDPTDYDLGYELRSATTVCREVLDVAFPAGTGAAAAGQRITAFLRKKKKEAAAAPKMRRHSSKDDVVLRSFLVHEARGDAADAAGSFRNASPSGGKVVDFDDASALQVHPE